MPFANVGVMEGSKFVLRALEVQARQAASSTLSSVISSATSAVATSSIPPTSASLTTSSTPTDSTINGNPTSTNGNNNGGNGGGGSQSSPLLFFVALGFGVVFTNLWIIVGVKYCFRYNARNRQMRMNEDGEPINLENMPRPHRRRREKKLMTMDEVNEKFPMLKYKTWVATRAQEGLPAQGGISAPNSRAGSIAEAEGIAGEMPSKERESTDDRPKTNASSKPKPDGTAAPGHRTQESTSSGIALTAEDAPATENNDTLRPQTARADLPRVVSTMTVDEDEEDDDHINAAIPPEALAAGDTCAICIDTLEDDDDVRGLTCGHAFHAVCLDPWLTSRRACCPLCKADYYVPKPRPQVADGTDGNAIGAAIVDPRNNRMNMPARPGHTFMSVLSVGGRNRGRLPFPSRFVAQGPNDPPRQQPQRQPPPNAATDGSWPFGFFHRARQQSSARPGDAAGAQEVQSESTRSRMPRLGLSMPRFGRRNNEAAPATGDAPISTAEATPSQLEAGTTTVR